jgi:hypothetical protein
MVVIRAANELLASGQCVWLKSSSVTYAASWHYASSWCTHFCVLIAQRAIDMFTGAIEVGYDQHALPPRLHVAAMPCLGGECWLQSSLICLGPDTVVAITVVRIIFDE